MSGVEGECDEEGGFCEEGEVVGKIPYPASRTDRDE